MDRVASRAQLVGEGADPVGESLDVVEQHDLGHLCHPHSAAMFE